MALKHNPPSRLNTSSCFTRMLHYYAYIWNQSWLAAAGGNEMKIWMLSFIAITLITGCSTLPSEPTPHIHAYSFQVLEIDVPLHALQSGWNASPSSSSLTDPSAESLFNAPKVQIYEYPIILAEVGSRVHLEQIKKDTYVADFNITDGKVITQEAVYKLGTTIELTLDDIENGVASFSIDLSTRNLKGFDTISMAGEEIRMPVLFEKQVVTSMRQELNSWMSLGAIEDITRKKDKTFRKYFVLRIIPPHLK